MNILHYAGISENNSSGVSVIVPEIISAQSELMNVCFYNYNEKSFKISDKVIQINKLHNDDYHTFPKPFNKPDVVIFHSPFGIKKSIRIAAMLRKDKIPYVIVPHGCFSDRALAKKKLKKKLAMNTIFKNMFSGATAIQFLSEGEKKSSIYKEKGIIIPNGIKLPEKTKRNFKKNIVNISFVGRKDVYYKGLDLLIKSCTLIKEKLRELGMIISIYGPYDVDGGIEFKKLIHEKEIGNIVRDLPPVFGKEKEKVYLETDVIILTSRSEGLPGVILEAWSYGCPTILTDGTNMSEEAIKNECGWKVSYNCEDIASTILEVCTCKNEIKKKSTNAIKYVKEKYNWSNIAKQYYKAYANIIKKEERICFKLKNINR